MQVGDIFNLNRYDEAFNFVNNNAGTQIKDLGNKTYQIVHESVIVPTVEEQNEVIRATREQLYVQTSDKLKADYDEAVARGSEDAEELKQAWLENKDKIREENPYVVEESALTTAIKEKIAEKNEAEQVPMDEVSELPVEVSAEDEPETGSETSNDDIKEGAE